MTFSAFMVASVMLAVPFECHLDCSGWDGKAQNEFGVKLMAMDGTTFKTTVRLEVDSEPVTARSLIWSGPEYHGWRAYTVGDTRLVLQGSKNSPIRSVEFTSTGWKPTVRWVPLLPQKK